MGSPAVAAFVAHAVFWGLLLYGWIFGELNLRRIAVFLILWLGAVGLQDVPSTPVSSFVALLDITLVFIIFKGDVRLT